MLREIVSTAPAEFTQHARNPANNRADRRQERRLLAGLWLALRHGPRQGPPLRHDRGFPNFVKLAQSSPWLHHSGGTICEPVDVPVNKRHLDMVYSHIQYSDRAFMGSVTAEEPGRGFDRHGAHRSSARDFVDRNCVILGNVNVNSPLVWDGTMTTALRAYARANQAAVIVPFILGGAMGPVTNAGAIAQSLRRDAWPAAR